MKTPNPIENYRDTLKHLAHALAVGVVLAAPAGAAPPVTVGLACQFDAAVGITTDADGILTWADQSGNGHNATRAEGTMQIIPNAINAKPAVHFVTFGNEDNQGTYAPVTGNMYSKTQFIVTKMDGGSWGAWMGSQVRSGYMWNPSGNCWDWNIPAAVSKNGSPLASYPYYLGDDRDSSYMILKIVGNDGDPSDTSQRLYGLGRQEGWGRLDNYMAELISYSTTLAEDDEDRVGGYLAEKYGLTTAYPPTTPSAIMKRFGSPENPAVVNQTDHTVTWYVPYGTDYKHLAPSYKLVYDATCDKDNGGPTTYDFTNPVTYTVISSNPLITQDYLVTVVEIPDWPTMINVNYSGGANGNLNGLFSFDLAARGSAASVAPANYAWKFWNDLTWYAESRSHLLDSTGAATNVGVMTYCDNGPWNDWNALGGAHISHAVVADYNAYHVVLALNGLDPNHQYGLYIASTYNNQSKPADWQVGATVIHLENTPGESVNWVEGKNYVHFSNLIPRADGTMVVNAKGNGEYTGITLNAFQLQDLGVRGQNPEALIYSFGLATPTPSITGTDISVIMPTGSNVSALKPSFTTSLGATVKVNGSPVVSGGTPVDFSGGPVTYTVKSEDSATTTDYTVTVHFVALPATIGLACWYDAAVGVTAVGGTVTAWNDQSSNGHHTAGGGNLTVLAENQLNGKPAVQFRASWLNVQGYMQTVQQYLVLKSAVPGWNSNGSMMGPVDSNYGSGNHDWRQLRPYAMRSDSPDNSGAFWPDPPPLGICKNGTKVAAQWGDNFSYPVAPTDQYMLLKIDVSTTYSGTWTPQHFCIGKAADNGSVDFDVAEIICYDRMLTGPEENALGAYIASKYGLTVAPRADTFLDVSAAGTGAEILNDGTLIEANHFGPDGIGPVTVNGVTFGTSWDHLSSEWNPGQATSTDGQGTVPALTDATDFGKLMREYIWNSASTASLTIPGLTVGNAYRLQWITSAPRGGNISVEGSASVPLSPTDWPESAYPSVLAFTWVAADTTANVLVTRQSGDYRTDNEMLFNAYALHDMGGGGGTTYAAWAIHNAPTGTATDDFDGDGVSNALEYVLGGTKDTKDLGKLPKISADGTKFTFTLPTSSASTATALRVEFSTDLSDWTTHAATTIASDASGLIEVTIPNLGARTFARLEVTIP